MHEWWDLQLKADFEGQIFEKFFHGHFCLENFYFFTKYRLRGSRRRNIFSYLMWGLNPCPISHKPTHFLPDYDDVITKLHLHT